MPAPNTQRIRLKLLTPYAVSLILIIASIQLLLYVYQQNKQQAYANSLNTELNRSLQQAIDNSARKASAFIEFIQDNQSISEAWIKQDRDQLQKASTPIYNRLREQHNFTHFYFHNADGTNFLRVHSPEKYGDLISRETFKRSLASLSTSSGIELGKTGHFALRTVTPWYINNELQGFMELGVEVSHIISQISELNDYMIVFSGSADFFKLPATHNTQTHKLSTDNHILFTTLDDIPDKLNHFINTAQHKQSTLLELGNSYYLTSNLFIQDIHGVDTSKLTYLYNFDNHVVYDNNFLWGTLLINSAIGMVLLIFYNYYSGKLEQQHKDSYQELQSEINERKSIENKLLRNKKQLEQLIIERDRSLSESRLRYRTLFEKTADALLLIENDRFIDCNQALLDMFLYTNKEDIYDTHPSQISPEFQDDGQASSLKADLMMQTAIEKGSHRFEWTHIRKNGQAFPAEVLLTAIPAGDKKLLHAVVRDISSRKEAEEEIKYRAYYDSLTNLPNRQLMIDRLKHAIITGRRRNNYNALLFIDLDRFKTINDSLGHSVGDLLLVETARRIRGCIREEDTASRFGGDEFVILIKNLGDDQEHSSLHAKRIAEDIQRSLLNPFRLKGHELHISSSIGINLFPMENESMEDIIKHADTAMYSAKESGRNKIDFYMSEMHESVHRKLTLEKDLRQTIREKGLTIHYQPQVDNDGKVIGVESLIRWQHSEHGFVNPEDFISIAEDTGMIYEIGAFVLNHSISDILSLQEFDCMPSQMSINISPHQFMHPEFVSQVEQVMQKYQLEKNFLTLEVTEGIAISNLSETIEKFQQLRNIGVRISLDDFGTGYSSLSYLKRLPLDELKIDKSFVFDVMQDPHDALLVQTIINIANQFGLDTVAEGVEGIEQLNFLKQESCKYYQGYYFSRPLPIDKLREFLQKN